MKEENNKNKKVSVSELPNVWEKRLFFYLIDNGSFKDEKEIAKYYSRELKSNGEEKEYNKRIDYDNGVKHFKKAIDKTEKERLIVLNEDGKYYLNLLIMMEKLQNRNLIEAWILTIKNHKEAFWEILSNKRYTFMDWVGKYKEFSEALMKTQSGMLQGENSICEQLFKRFLPNK